MEIITNTSSNSFNFKSIFDINNFIKKSQTQMAFLLSDIVKNDIKIICETEIYYYNIIKQLWVKMNKNEYNTFITLFLDNSAEEVKKIIKDLPNNDEEDNQEKTNKYRTLIKQFDNKLFIETFSSAFSFLISLMSFISNS